MTARGATLCDGEVTLVLRDPADAGEWFALVERHRDDLREWLPWVDATRSLADARRYAQFAKVQAESRLGFDFAIRVDGAIAGSTGLHGLDWSNRSAQIGYFLAPGARGRGVIDRACALLAAFAFEQERMHRLEIRCVVENARSRAVAERLGFAYEGVLAEANLLHGTFRDLALYATTVTRPWPAARPQADRRAE